MAYIDREAAIQRLMAPKPDSPDLTPFCLCLGDRIDVQRFLEFCPDADVAPVRHGRWKRIGVKGRKGLPIYPCCSACGMVSAAYRSEWEGLRGAWKFCPNCGAKMDGGAENAR